MAADRNDDEPKNFAAPGYFAQPVTPSDTVDLAYCTRGLYVGGAGNVTVVMQGDGSTVLFTGVPAGTVLPIAVARVKATGTTATSMVAIN